MKKSIYACVSIFLSITFCCVGQADSSAFKAIEISGFNNSTTLFGFVKTPIHPGIRLAGTWNFYASKKQFPVVDVNAGYYFQEYAHHGIQLYGTLNYIAQPNKRFLITPGVGLGAMMTIPDVDVWQLNDNGEYENISGIRMQMTVHVQCKLGYRTKDQLAIYLMPQFWLHMPYVNSYVPVLPNSSLHLGIAVPMDKLMSK